MQGTSIRRRPLAARSTPEIDRSAEISLRTNEQPDRGGPAWLAERRAAAFERWAGSELPTSGEEIWRYSRVDDLDLDRFAPPSGTTPSDVPAEVRSRLGDVGAAAAVVATVNGRVTSVEVAPGPAAKGLAAGALVDVDGGAELLGPVVGTRSDPFVSLHDAFASEPVLVRIPSGVALEDPVVVLHWIEGDGVAAFPRSVVVAESESEATVLQIVASPDGAVTLSVPVTEVSVGPAARLRTMETQELGSEAWQLGYYFARVDRDASLASSAVALGAHYARLRLDVGLDGKGAEADLIAVYFGESDQMHDFRTRQDHTAPRTRSDLLFKGAVEDRARSVYSGLIKVHPAASGTSAFQTNRNIKLSPDAWAESVPNLEIENNDVRCSHASAVGPIDEDQLYYLESRGIPPETAERLVVLGFFDEVIARLPVAGLRSSLRHAVADKFARRGVRT